MAKETVKCICLVLLLAFPFQLLAQDSTRFYRHPNGLKSNVFAPISLFYERALTPRFVLRTSVRGWNFKIKRLNQTQFINITLEGKFYTAKQERLRQNSHPSGFFINPYLKARSLVIYNEGGRPDDKVIYNSLGMGLTIGYQWVFSNRMLLEFFHGGGGFPISKFRYATVKREASEYYRMDLRSGLSIGYAF